MNTNNNSEGLMYKAFAFAIFIVLVTLIVLISVSTVRSREESSTEPDTDPIADTTPAETSAEPPDLPVTETDETPKATETTQSPETSRVPGNTAADPVEPPAVIIDESTAEFLKNYPDTVLGETEDAGQEYINKIVFLGDSTTYGLRAYKMLAGGKETTQVWTPNSGTLTLTQAEFIKIYYPDTKEQLTIKEAVTKKQPEYLVITLGVNGVSFMGEEYFKTEYKKIIQTVQDVSPDTKIICQSIFPVARSYAKLKDINNEKINAANRWIVEVASECGVKYVDTNSALRDEEGWLPENYHNGDGMHLQTNSFTIELDNLRTHAWVEDEK